MTSPAGPPTRPSSTLEGYPFLDALLDRRSRRFGKGMTLDGGPLQYTSALAPEPLTPEEEAAIVFAGAGFTGHALAELPFSHGATDGESGCGNIISHLFGRTMISGDAVHSATLFVMNDEGTWMVRRPQDFSSPEVLELIALGRARRFLDFFHAARVKVADTRAAVPRQVPDVPAFNKWSVNLPGMSYFLPVNDLSAFYINVLLTMFDEEFGFYVVDDTKRFGPAGIGNFRKSKGGHLRDDEITRTISITILEGWVHEFAAIEQGAAIQNMALMTQALGLGGFPHFAHHPWSWPPGAWLPHGRRKVQPHHWRGLAFEDAHARAQARLDDARRCRPRTGWERDPQALLPAVLPRHARGSGSLRGGEVWRPRIVEGPHRREHVEIAASGGEGHTPQLAHGYRDHGGLLYLSLRTIRAISRDERPLPHRHSLRGVPP